MKLMKSCPTCGRVFDDLTFSFCLDDGSVLSTPFDEAASDGMSETETVVLRGSEEPTVRIEGGVTGPADSVAAEIEESVILIALNRLYKPGIPAGTLYEITRGIWRIGERRNGVRYAFATYKGIIREVYEIESWHPAPAEASEERKNWIADKAIDIEDAANKRWQFDGRIAPEMQHYIGLNTSRYQVRGAQNPIKYVNC